MFATVNCIYTFLNSRAASTHSASLCVPLACSAVLSLLVSVGLFGVSWLMLSLRMCKHVVRGFQMRRELM